MYESNKKYMYVKHLNNWKTNFPNPLSWARYFPQHRVYLHSISSFIGPGSRVAHWLHELQSSKWEPQDMDLYYPRLTLWLSTVPGDGNKRDPERENWPCRVMLPILPIQSISNSRLLPSPGTWLKLMGLLLGDKMNCTARFDKHFSENSFACLGSREQCSWGGKLVELSENILQT